MRLKLTKVSLDKLVRLTREAGEAAERDGGDGPRRLRIFDTDTPGFGAVVLPTGRVSFFVQYRGKHHRRAVVGHFGKLTVDQAREKAKRMLGGWEANSVDPLEERQAQREAPTFADWLDGGVVAGEDPAPGSYLAEIKLRRKSADEMARYLLWAKARWGNRRLDELDADDIRRAFDERHAQSGKISANRFLATLNACLQAAWRSGRLVENPARRVRPLPENPPRVRVLSDEELAAVLKALDEVTDPHVRLAFELVLATGARKSEVLGARWADVDLDGALWRLPETKSGKPQVIPLSKSTVAMLRNTPRVGPWLIPGRDPEHPRDDLRRAWRELRKAAGVSGVTIHDLRRTFGLHAAKTAGLHVASKLLRHSRIGVTESVYAPLGIADLRRATEQVARGRAKVLKLARAEGDAK